MNRIETTAVADMDGVLHLKLGAAAAKQVVRVTVEPLGPPTMTQEQWRQLVLETAGKWEGEFERPEPGELEEREPLP
jgi:hypothetical protein